jgi:hypothetical protein
MGKIARPRNNYFTRAYWELIMGKIAGPRNNYFTKILSRWGSECTTVPNPASPRGDSSPVNPLQRGIEPSLLVATIPHPPSNQVGVRG